MPVNVRNDQKKVKITPELRALLKNSVQETIKQSGIDFKYEITLVVTGNDGIRELNAAHRDIDSPTDVLSFPLLEFDGGFYEPDEFDFNPDTGRIELGDIVISIEKAIEQASEYGHPVEREMAFLAAHGALHLLGYDHADSDEEALMRKMQKSVMNKLGLGRERKGK